MHSEVDKNQRADGSFVMMAVLEIYLPQLEQEQLVPQLPVVVHCQLWLEPFGGE
jgi:hypothetical protein